jgi:NADH-quinone oxidoreductase subunit L
VTWVGAVTAVFAASIAVAQNDIKRILAYSTVSQLGYMMMGLGVGGVAVGMFHLLTHAFFKALLFLGSGSVIHGCHEEQDIRRMGGLRKFMPVTFATYAAGMLALAGFPLLFSGFWSKDEILHATHGWPVSQGPFYLCLLGALLTAFYMTRQMIYVFFGPSRLTAPGGHSSLPHESPAVMTVPLVILAGCAVGLGFLGTPAWPWLQDYLSGAGQGRDGLDWQRFASDGLFALMLLSTVIVLTGLGLGWWLYGRQPITNSSSPDALQLVRPLLFAWLQGKFYVDEFYERTVIRFNAWWAGACDLLDRWIWGGAVLVFNYVAIGLSWASRLFDEYVVNLGFDTSCREIARGGRQAAGLADGKLPNYLRGVGTAVVCLLLLLTWGGCR